MGVYVSNVLMGSSSWNAAHFLQMLTLGYPSRFDHGTEKNLAKYGVETPPRYNISNIDSAHIALIYTASDWFNHLEAVDQLKDNLKGIFPSSHKLIPKLINHLSCSKTYRRLPGSRSKLEPSRPHLGQESRSVRQHSGFKYFVSILID